MQMWVISEQTPLANNIRQVVTRMGHNCPATQVVSYSSAIKVLSANSEQIQCLLLTTNSQTSQFLGTIRQLRSMTGVPLIAIGPSDPQLILDCLHAGIDDYLDESRQIAVELTDALQRQFATRGLSTPIGKLIAVTAASGGSGRSTIAVNLAVALTANQSRPCLLDLDPSTGVCASLLNLKPRHTLADLGRASEKLDRKTLEQALISHESGVSVLPAPLEITDRYAHSSELAERIIRNAQDLSSTVILDWHDFSEEAFLKWLIKRECTFVLATRLDFNSLCNTGRAIKYYERHGVDPSQIRVVVNRYGQPQEVPVKSAEKALSISIPYLIPDDPQTVNRASSTGYPVVLSAPKSPVAKPLFALAQDLCPPLVPNGG